MQNVTRSGNICQKWGVTTPNNHTYAPKNFTEAGIDGKENNYCRNPTDKNQTAELKDTIWCFITNETVKWKNGTKDGEAEWEYCDPKYELNVTEKNILNDAVEEERLEYNGKEEIVDSYLPTYPLKPTT